MTLGNLDRVLDTLREAEILAEALGDQRRLGSVCAYLAGSYCLAGDMERALAVGQRGLALSEATGDVAFQMMGALYLGLGYHALGEYPRALEYLRRAIATLGGARFPERFSPRGGWLPAVLVRTYGVWCLAETGAFAEGHAWGAEAVRIAAAVDTPYTRIQTCFGVGYLALCQGDLPQAVSMLERGFELCRTVDIQLWLPLLAWALGVAYARSGRVSEALPLLEHAVAQEVAMGLVVYQSPLLASLSEALLLGERQEEALSLAERALVLARTYRVRGWEAYALWLLAKIAAHREPPAAQEAEAYYRHRPVPRHGDDFLATSGGGNAGAGG